MPLSILTNIGALWHVLSDSRANLPGLSVYENSFSLLVENITSRFGPF